VVDLTVKVEVKGEGRNRAKATKIDLNRKMIKFPRKATHSSVDNTHDVALYRKDFGNQPFTEIAIQITPSRLKKIVANDSEHQRIKDQLRRALSDSGDKGLNIGYPYLLNQKSQGESDADFKPFGKPTRKMIERIFDLFDISGMDMVILPSPSPNGNSTDWCKMATDVFTTRKPDFMNEFVFSGMVPIGIPSKKASDIANYYLKNKLESLTFDFASRKISEVRMKEIIVEVGDKWGDVHVHATNVPSYNWYGTYKQTAIPTYDLLISTYGFDSFGNLRSGRGGDTIEKQKIKPKMRTKRFRLTETYGDYNYNGLKTIMEHEDIKMKSPVVKSKNPLDIYDKKENTKDAYDQLTSELKRHRNFVTHSEMNGLYDKIKNKKYNDYLDTKKVATKELQSIYIQLGTKGFDEF